MTDVREEKSRWRQDLLQRRQAFAHVAEKAEALRDQLLTNVPFPDKAIVAGYWPIRGEIDPRPALRTLDQRGHVCALPVVMGVSQPLLFRRWSPEISLVKEKHGLWVPPPESPVLSPVVLLVPMVGFDRQGYRLGYGAGHYDRTLQSLRAMGPVLAVGVAFAAQEILTVPRERHDIPMDWIVTESYALPLKGSA